MASGARHLLGSRTRLLIGLVVVVVVAVVVAAVVLVAVRSRDGESASAPACPGDTAAARPDWAPFSEDFRAGYDRHPFVGNGYLGLRVPPAGTGYVETGERTGWPLYTPRYDGAFVAGLYGAEPGLADGRTVAAALPNWSTLQVTVNGETLTPALSPDQVSNFRQTEYLRCGLVRTALTWTTRDGRATDLVYDVLADRADQHTAAVHLTLTPHWDGPATITGLLDMAGARRLDRTAIATPDANTTALEFRTRTTNVVGDVVSVLAAGNAPVRQQETSQRAELQVSQGNSYEITKYVGVDTALTAPDPARAATDAAHRAAARGWANLLAEQARQWRELWSADIEVPGDPDTQRWVRGALYSLYSATNAQQDNSISPTGLSSDNYAGLIFWDADIWMYPGLLQLAPNLARSVVDYRFKTLPAARENARRLGLPGAFYPWTSAATGDLNTDCHSWSPPHCLIQNHLQGDVALAVWQYYLATKDLGYLRDRGWPVLSAVAEYWAARVTADPDGGYSIRDVAGPDEYSNGVDDGVYTNAVAAEALRNATAAARLLNQPAPPAWTDVADHLRIPFDPVNGVFLQYAGYRGAQIKQADTVLLQYPLEWPMSPEVAAKTLDYYAERTDPDGPAMTDSVHAIDAARNNEPGCSVATYLERSARPFAREPFGQFSEARGAKAGANDPLAGSPAFDFTTLAGGYLQEFTNGLLGLRLREDRVVLDPMLTPRLAAGLTVRGLRWQGRVFDVAAGPERTTVTLRSGDPLPVETNSGLRQVASNGTLELPTRRPDLVPTDDAARCKATAASSEQPGDYAAAAVDGDTATSWLPDSSRADLTVDLGATVTLTRVSPRWTEPAPVTSSILVSGDNRTWSQVATTPLGELLQPTSARYVRIQVDGGDPTARPGIREVDVATRPR
ncbi:discoidin domain-containing protein [Nocardia sp. NPDC003482]